MKNLNVTLELLISIMLAELHELFLNAEEPSLEQEVLCFIENYSQSGWEGNLRLTTHPEGHKGRNDPEHKKRTVLVYHSPYLNNNHLEHEGKIVIPIVNQRTILFKQAKVEHPNGRLSNIKEVFGTKAAKAIEEELHDIRELLTTF